VLQEDVKKKSQPNKISARFLPSTPTSPKYAERETRGRSEAADQSGQIGILLRVLRGGGIDKETAIGGASN